MTVYQPLSVRRGDALKLMLVWTNSDGSPVDTTSMDFNLTVWQDEQTTALHSGGDFLTVNGNSIGINVPGSVTNGWGVTTLWWEVRYQVSGGSPDSIVNGPLTILEATRDGSFTP